MKSPVMDHSGLFLARVEHMLTALIYALIPSVVAIIGTIGATMRQPGSTLRSALLHFAAGVILAVVALELLPQVTQARGQIVWIVAGFVLGVLVMLGVRRLDRRSDPTSASGVQKSGWPIGLIAGNVVDQIVGGIVLGVGLAAGKNLGALLSLSMTVEDLSFGLAIATVLGAAGATRWQMIGTTTAFGVLFVAVTVAGAAILGVFPRQIITLLLAFGAAALLFVVIEQLIVEAHEIPKAPPLAAALFAGFLLILVLGMLSAPAGTGSARSPVPSAVRHYEAARRVCHICVPKRL